MRPFLALMLAAIATPAMAQDGSEAALSRTPVNAQLFLQKFPPNWISMNKSTAWIQTMTSTDACITEFSGPLMLRADDGSFGPNPNSPVQHYRIDWSQVEAIAGSDVLVNFSLRTPKSEISTGFVLMYSVPETRDRALAAAQYLKTACDKGGQLGF